MIIEHIGLTVSEPLKMADWYVKNLGCDILYSDADENHQTVFLADEEHSTILELIWQPGLAATQSLLQNTFQLHLAFLSDDPAADRAKLENAGAVYLSGGEVKPGANVLMMLRDPWGNAIQLVKRVTFTMKSSK